MWNEPMPASNVTMLRIWEGCVEKQLSGLKEAYYLMVGGYIQVQSTTY